MKLLLLNSKHIITTGNTGTGKTINITKMLTIGFGDNFQSTAFTFSAQTSANNTQDMIDEKL